MAAFKHFPKDDTCIVCGGNEDKECLLIPMDGTQEGHNAQAKIVHVDCMAQGWYYPDRKMIAIITKL